MIRHRLIIPVLLLVVLLPGILLVLPAHANAISTAINPSVTIQQTSTAMKTGAVLDPFYHNSSTSNQSPQVKVPVNLTGYTSIAGFTFLLTVSANSYVPQIVANQSTHTFFNSTLSAQAAFSPTPGNNKVVLTTFTLYTPAGLDPANGQYPVWDNYTQTIPFTDATPSGWSLSGATFSISDNATAAFGYYVNSTIIYFPFPVGIGVNYSSVSATNGKFFTSQGGVLVYNNSIAPGKSFATTVTFQPVPITTGPAVFIQLTKARLIAGTFSSYTSFGNFTNNLGLPYFGLYVLEVSFSNYTLNPASVTILENGKAASKATYSVNPASITILPNNLLIGVGQNVAIQANFTSLQVPPTASLTPTTVLITLNGFPV
ncbi:MAG: hypothetical protein WA549_08465, partial [Thermoplasmata archaeon]